MDWKIVGLVGVLGSSGCMDLNLNLGQGVRGSGKLASESRKVSAFSKIEARGAFDVDVNVGQDEAVKISGDDNLIKLIDTHVENGILIVGSKKNLQPRNKLHVTISAPKLEEFSLNGAGDVDIEGLHEDSLTLNVRGAGDLKAAGQAKQLNVTLKGAGDMNLYDLHSEDATAELSGAGDISIYATKHLKAKVSGVGDLSYKGHPAQVEKTKSGVGDIEAAD